MYNDDTTDRTGRKSCRDSVINPDQLLNIAAMTLELVASFSSRECEK
jgi:hypothetical protein